MEATMQDGSKLVGDDGNRIIFCRGIVALCGATIDKVAEAGLGNVDEAWQKARRDRDGEHFHVTVLTKADLQRAGETLRTSGLEEEFSASLQAAGLPLPDPENVASVAHAAAALVSHRLDGLSSWVDVGEGTARDDGGEAVFRVIVWPAGAEVRRALGLTPQDFHMTLGFHNHDVHSKSKGFGSLATGAPSADSVPKLVAEATQLLDAGSGLNIDALGIEQLADAGLLGATANGDEVGEAEALRVLCVLHGRMKQVHRVLPCADRLLELDPTDEVGSRSRAFALLMSKRFEEALPALALARAQLYKLQKDKREVEEGRIRQAEGLCQKKLGCVAKDIMEEESSTLFCSDGDYDRAFFETRALKFPSTAHIKNLGAATRDDKLLDAKRQNQFCGGGRKVCVEEKVDGANLGISLDSQYAPRLQGRSKYVNWETDHQFRGLKEWLEEHASALFEMLERNQHVLFGEWCAYKHTVPYNRLPGYFIAFDIYDRRVERFLSRQSFHTRLANSPEPRIPAIPVVTCKVFAAISEVEALLQTQSSFGQEVIEGVYLRVDEDVPAPGCTETYLEDRCKLVRSEFQQAIEESEGGWRGRGRNELDMDMKATYPSQSFVFAASASAPAPAPAETAEDGSVPGSEQVAGKDNYPKTPHLPFSPGVNSDDDVIGDAAFLIAEEVVVTEKLDGGNCCIKNGLVYARTHSKPTTCKSFSPVKELIRTFAVNLEGVELFGENVTAIHSIEYGNLGSYFYLFGVRRGSEWLSWDETVELAEQLSLPTVPLLFRGRFRDQRQLQGCIETWAREPSAVGANVNPEGFVVRRAAAIPASKFHENIAKFVRPNHIQTDENWNRRWKKARLGTELPKRPLRSLGEPLRNKLHDPRDRHKITTPGVGEVELPRNFSFILDDVAVSSTPKRREQILAMASMEITLVVTLTEETPLPEEWFKGTGVRNSFVPVPNYYPPSVGQADAILLDIACTIASGKRVMVHCGGGKGRAGTVASCLLLRYGVVSVEAGLSRERDEGLSSCCQMQSDEVLTLLRDARPGSVETERQERFIRGYASTLWGRMADAPDIPELVRQASRARSEHEEDEIISKGLFVDLISEAPKDVGKSQSSAKAKREAQELEKMKKDKAKRAPKFIMCVGLPGSGKSTFSKALESSGAWVRANQDELGRKGCEKRLSETVPKVRQGLTRLVLDRCNTSKTERKEWMDMLGQPAAKDVVCVFFETPAEVCKQRAAARLDHETIRPGGGGRIIDDIAKRFEPPSATEGKNGERIFSTVEVMKTAEDAAAFLRRIGVDPEPVLAAARGVAPLVAADTADGGAELAETMSEEDEAEREDALPEAFMAWLRKALCEEVGEADAEGLGAAVEVILADPSAVDSAVEVLADSGAPKTAALLPEQWQDAVQTFAPPTRSKVKC